MSDTGDAQSADFRRVGAEDLTAFSAAVFGQCGMVEADAMLLADSLTAADLRGVHSHGVLRVPEYVRKLTVRGVDPRGRPRISRDSGACLVVDGGNSMGQIGTQFAMQSAIERASLHGISAVAIGGSNHCGALAYYAMQALRHDMIGFAATNAMPIMPPWGGKDRVLGINPIAVAIPAGSELPVVYDAAFSGSSHGKIRIYGQTGKTLPEGWALDREGQPTTDPAVAIQGLLQPIGGFKGVALAMIAGMLSSFLSGAAFATEMVAPEGGARPGCDGHFVAALRVGAFEDPERFKERVDQAVRSLRASSLAPGFQRIYSPGEIEAETEAKYRREGIPINAMTAADLRTVAAELGVPLPESLQA